ncbi:hypothetical protein EPUS_09301 [Endocarpon pusillum Z07020]|uniref:Insecticide toxin TcdB middle/N-terminal domain-containing protein n=1 Tax=Endocarpon pusillum (strain Z07020 / HMAS-L-300199) TaxID=1263415 RepID=U1G277_ENDPU|nr:uncharacterized protein EPUS_09301 [Endocarpon pusillum Z07020]ERF71377.1 hypothetical protein EPUS_09301 [Endocarpon pusillum Z07020]
MGPLEWVGNSQQLPSVAKPVKAPRYDDRNQSDVYMLFGAEDLVPIVAADGSVHEDINAVPGYAIRRYRPRVEGGFSQIEQWTNISDRTDVHWRQLSGNNVLTTYGLDSNSRISNPEEPGQIYEWLICNSRDCKGNVVHYTYKPEDGVGADVALAHQHNRGPGTDPRRTSNRYLKSVVYGNTIPLLDGSGNRPLFLSTVQMDSAGWMFEVVLDYGEHDTNNPTPGDTNPWHYRLDSFSNYRPGFEVRTSRVCQRFLMFHHFPEEVAVGKDYLVRSVEFGYTHGDSADLASIFTYLTSVQQSGYRKGPQGQYIRKLLPPLEFTYSKAHLDDELKDIDPAFLRDLPAGLATSKTQWIDLHGESISGMLTADEQAWYYKKNTSPLYETVSQGRKVTKPRFEHNQQIRSMPNGALRPQKAQFADITGTGRLAIICEDDGLIGCYEHDDAESWLPFRSFNQSINGASYFNSNIKLVDLNGDGLTDILAPELGQWFASLGADGFGLPHAFTNAVDEETGPSLLYTDDMQTVRLADFSGDGMPDIVRLRNGEVCYWPNLGHGRFGAKILMDHSPIFDASDTFDARHIILADIDGSGTTDLIYPHRDGAKIYFNQCGNGWSTPRLLETVPTFDSVGTFTAIDLLGNGTSCLVISSPLPNACSMQYIELMGGIKPHLLTKIDNNLGSVTEIFYESSTKFYLQDKYGGHPWVSKLAFPVHVVESVQTFDRISQNSFRTRYAYHHGFYDAEDREFRGFGMVEQWDVEGISAIADPKVRGSANQAAPWAIPPIYTKTWFHQGASYEQGTISRRYEQEYYREPGQNEATAQKWLLPDTVLPLDISAADIHDACRALKGKMLRQETYAIDVFAKPAEGPPTSSAPFTVVESNFTLQIIQSKQSNHSAVALASGRETLTITYERHLSDPRIKHAMILETNSFGQILKELSITYGRIQSDSSFPTSWDRDMQSQSFLTYIENTPTNAIEDPHVYPNNFRLPNFCETRKYELTGFDIQARNGPAMLKDWTADDFAVINSAVKIGFEVTPTPNVKQKRLLKHDRTLLRKDDLSGLLPLTKMEPRALAGKTYKLAFTSQMVNLHLQKDGVPLLSSPESLLSGETPSEGGYVSGGSLSSSGLFPSEEGNGTIGTWWAPSGQLFFASSNDPAQELDSARQTFFLPRRVQNQFKAESTVTYDKYNYLVLETTDLVGNRTTVGERDASGRLLSSGIDYRVLQPFLITDINGNRSQVEFDALGMVTATAVKGKVGESLGDNIAGLDADLPEDTLLDHIRNPTAAESSQRICREYKNTVDWAALDPIIPKHNTDRFDPAALEGVLSTLVEDENFKVSSTHDAMNRLLTSVLPHSTPDNISTVRPGYDLLSLVRIDYNLHGKVDGDQPVWTPFLKDVDYHPTGQRRFVLLGNDVRTDYKYDIDRKLIQMTTQRGGSAADTVQDIKYTYDAIHNITNIVDAAQQTKFFRNVVVKPINDYTYDALYRLLEATGREHLGQADQPFWYSNSDSARFGPQPGDGNAMARYTEQYSYDDAGNMLKMKHDSSNTQQGSRSSSWTRTFDYREKGSIDSTQTGNRLSSTSVGNATENYGYDNHGNMVRIPQIGGSANVDNAQWDYIDKLKSLNLGGGGTAYFTYGSDGKRVRKVIEKGPNLVEERLYLGSAELFRRKKSGGIVLERETIHAMDNQRRVALIETRTIDTEGTDRAPGQLIRYQVSTHLDSSSIELDDTAQLLSFEEYSPYGNTTYQGTASTLETPKRYRFTGKERDEESGLSYHGARYYAPWLARWISQDALGIGDGLNTYVYCHDDPVGGKDPTGMDDTPSFASFDPLMSEISDSDFKFESITPQPAPLTPLATPMTKAQADAHSSVQRSKYRANPTPETPYLETKSVPPWKGAKVQAGHTVPARYATDGLSPADWDKQTMQRLESRSYDVAIMDQSGEIDITTRHRAQDFTMIDDAVADAQKAQKAATGVSALPPEGSMHMGDYQIWRSENIPLDEGKVEFIKSMGEAPIDHTITTEMKLAAAEGDLFVKASKASKLGKGAKALKLLGKAGRHFVAALPVLGMVMGHASAAHAAANGDLQGAALDEAGFIPVAGDLLDAGRGGLALGEALDEGLGISDVAVEHGAVADKLAQDMGFSRETSMYIGAGTSALSAITVSPGIALHKTATEYADKAADKLIKWWNSD